PGDRGEGQVVDRERGEAADLHREQGDGDRLGPPGEERDRRQHRGRGGRGQEGVAPQRPPVPREGGDHAGEDPGVVVAAPPVQGRRDGRERGQPGHHPEREQAERRPGERRVADPLEPPQRGARPPGSHESHLVPMNGAFVGTYPTGGPLAGTGGAGSGGHRRVSRSPARRIVASSVKRTCSSPKSTPSPIAVARAGSGASERVGSSAVSSAASSTRGVLIRSVRRVLVIFRRVWRRGGLASMAVSVCSPRRPGVRLVSHAIPEPERTAQRPSAGSAGQSLCSRNVHSRGSSAASRSRSTSRPRGVTTNVRSTRRTPSAGSNIAADSATARTQPSRVTTSRSRGCAVNGRSL